MKTSNGIRLLYATLHDKLHASRPHYPTDQINCRINPSSLLGQMLNSFLGIVGQSKILDTVSIGHWTLPWKPN